MPDSDDEAIVDDEEFPALLRKEVKRKKVESNLQRWIKHLSILLKEEQRKVCRTSVLPSSKLISNRRQYKEKKKRIEKAAPPDEKVRVPRVSWWLSLVRLGQPQLRFSERVFQVAVY